MGVGSVTCDAAPATGAPCTFGGLGSSESGWMPFALEVDEVKGLAFVGVLELRRPRLRGVRVVMAGGAGWSGTRAVSRRRRGVVRESIVYGCCLCLLDWGGWLWL